MAIPVSCKVRDVIRFLQEEGYSATEIHRFLCRIRMTFLLEEIQGWMLI